MRDAPLAPLNDAWFGSMPESRMAMPMPVPSSVMPCTLDRTASAPVVSETWPIVLKFLSREMYCTSVRLAKLLTAATGNSTTRGLKLLNCFLTVPQLLLMAVDNPLDHAPFG